METYLTPEDVAEVLCVTPTTVYRLIRRGRLPAGRVGRLWRVAESDVRKMMQAGQVYGEEAPGPFPETLTRP